MFNRLKFLGKVKEEGKTIKEVADFLGLNVATLYRKMNGESDFYREEMQQLIIFLNISNPMEIFFAQKVA